jgi:hypothetical protein
MSARMIGQGHARSTERSASPLAGRAKGSSLSAEKPERDLLLNSLADQGGIFQSAFDSVRVSMRERADHERLLDSRPDFGGRSVRSPPKSQSRIWLNKCGQGCIPGTVLGPKQVYEKNAGILIVASNDTLMRHQPSTWLLRIIVGATCFIMFATAAAMLFL